MNIGTLHFGHDVGKRSDIGTDSKVFNKEERRLAIDSLSSAFCQHLIPVTPIH